VDIAVVADMDRTIAARQQDHARPHRGRLDQRRVGARDVDSLVGHGSDRQQRKQKDGTNTAPPETARHRKSPYQSRFKPGPGCRRMIPPAAA
jgi:hypothetical protein